MNNTKTNFFDHLDGGWGDIIADTYRSSQSIIFSSSENLINNEPLNVQIDKDDEALEVEQSYTVDYDYKEIYLSKDTRYKIIILYKSTVTLYTKTIELKIYIVGSEYNNEWINGPNVRLFNKLTIGATATSNRGKYTKLEQKDNYTDAIPYDATYRINHKFFSDFIKRALDATDYEASRTDWDKYESIYTKLGHTHNLLTVAMRQINNI